MKLPTLHRLRRLMTHSPFVPAREYAAFKTREILHTPGWALRVPDGCLQLIYYRGPDEEPGRQITRILNYLGTYGIDANKHVLLSSDMLTKFRWKESLCKSSHNLVDVTSS